MIESLAGAAARVAGELVSSFPDAKIISARRTVANQALQMARNVVRNRQWIADTYARPLCRAARACHEFAIKNDKATAGELAWMFTRVIDALPDGEQRQLSKHLTGEAFDVSPGGPEMENFLRDAAVREGGKFLTSEGGLVIWHWQGP